MKQVISTDEGNQSDTKFSAEVVGEIVNDENVYRLCSAQGAEGILVGLAEEVGKL